MVIEVRQTQRFREFMQTVARHPRENAPRKLDRAKSWRIELDTAALQFRRHELTIELHVVRNENAAFQKLRHMFRNRRKLRLPLNHLVADSRQFTDKRRNRMPRVDKRMVRLDNIGTVHQDNSDFHNPV